MFHRPLAFLSGLTVGDYLLWTWSLNGNHDVLALVSGLTLPPLVIASLWLLALSLARFIARSSPRSRVQSARRHAAAMEEQAQPALGSTPTAGPVEETPVSAGTSAPTRGKLAA